MSSRQIIRRARSRFGPRLAGRLRALGRDTSGMVALLVGLLLPVLAGIGMLGVDAGVWYWERRNLQSAADAAAAAGAWHRFDVGTNGLQAAAERDAARNGWAGSIDVRNPPTSGNGSDDQMAVAVTLTEDLPLFYAKALGHQNADVVARATATIEVDNDFCILGLDDSMDGAVTVRGNADLDLTCGIAVNSSSEDALQVSGSAAINATDVNIVGGLDTNGNPTVNSAGGVKTGQRPVTDPYADLEVPAYGACDENNYRGNDTETINPGTYCGGMDFGAQGDVTLSPGVYIVVGGQFNVNGQASIRGEGVTIILTDDATMRINGGADVELSAPTSGDWSGVAIYQDRESSAGITNRINGGADLNLQGAVYFPAQEVEFTGNSDVGAGCLQVIANQVTISGAGTIGNDCDTAGTESLGTPRLSFLR